MNRVPMLLWTAAVHTDHPRMPRPDRRTLALAAALIATLAWGCDTAPGAAPADAERPSPDATADARPMDAERAADANTDAGADADTSTTISCNCDPDETCAACIAHIGECCYEDPALGGQADLLAATCEGAAACRACCAECEALDCDTLKRTGSCPNLPTPASADAVARANGVQLNGNPLQFIHTGPLSANADLTALLRANPGSAFFLSYIVECALPEGASISIEAEPGAEPLVFRGSVGLAPEWADAPCDVACQEWVSACVFARTNRYELTVQVFLSGPHPAFDEAVAVEGTAEENGFTVREGAFYGNFFAAVPHELSCRGDGHDPLYRAIRVCALPGNLCGFSQVGPCGATDGDTLLPSERHACRSESATGDYLECHDRATLPGSDAFPEPSREYTRVVTTYVRPSVFQPGIVTSGLGSPEGPVACGDAPPATDEPPLEAGPAHAGARCANDDDCRSETLICDARSQWGFCTAACVPDDDVTAEAEACGGPGSTCLSAAPGEGTCTHACRPGSDTGAAASCAPGQVCTHEWLFQSPADSQAGCTPFCSSDADCPAGVPCFSRVGACGAIVDESLLPDGTPCDPIEAECRGGCVLVGDQPDEGLCASLLNFTQTTVCPDDPEIIEPLAPGGPGRGDDLALCMYRKCADDTDCAMPLRCLSGVIGGTKVCGWP